MSPGTPTANLADPFLDTLQARTWGYFWNTTNPANGLTPDRWPTQTFSSIAAVGFALTAYPVGVERGYVGRAEAAQRTLLTLRSLWKLPQGPASSEVAGYQGFFYHFLDMNTGQRFKQVELSTVDTALLIAGVLMCREYFDAAGPDEAGVRAYADSLYERVDWTWAQNHPPTIALGWKPEDGFVPYDWRGYNEAMILYVLALGSPTHPIGPEAWGAWTAPYQWGTFYGQDFVQFAPLFGHQYSHVWVDFRGIQDAYMRGRGIDYFENSRRATLAQRAYAVANPGAWEGYGPNVWGLTASDGPADATLTLAGRPRTFHTYWARGAAQSEVNDDGTIAPTAAGGSIAFAPEIAVPALLEMRSRYGDNVFGVYGFVDAFNPTFTAAPQQGRVVPGAEWFDTDYLGIDQGPILLMIENARSELIWKTMRRSPYIRCGLLRAGFSGGWLSDAARPAACAA